MTDAELIFVPYRQARHHVRDADLLLFRRRGLISIAGRGDHSHAAKAAWWAEDLSFVESFNRSMLSADQSVWAVAVPITVCYEGDVEPGMAVEGRAFSFEQLGGSPEPSTALPATGSCSAVPSSAVARPATPHGPAPGATAPASPPGV